MLDFVFWDVQHGSAAYIKTPLPKHFVGDLGTGSYGSASGKSAGEFSPLRHLKNKYGVKRLDGVIVTHPHRDHLDDIFVFDDLSPKVLIRPKHIPEKDVRAGNRGEDKDVVDKYLEISARYKFGVAGGEDPYAAANNGGVVFTRFHPKSAVTSQLNNHSITMVVEYAKSKMLITGDNEATAWKELLEQKTFTTAIKGTDILLASHHGRESGYCTELFDHITPKLAIISDGRFCDTSATARYSEKSSGWKVHKRSGGSEDRNCVTTRSDGVITVRFGFTSEQKPFIEVEVD